MIDPMADLGNSGVSNESDAKEVFDPNALNQNMMRIDKVRSFMGIVSGCVAGISGFTGLEGLVCFIVLHLVVLFTIAGFKMNFDLKTHTRQSWFGYLTTNLQQSALSFMLFWTLFYGLVYLYWDITNLNIIARCITIFVPIFICQSIYIRRRKKKSTSKKINLVSVPQTLLAFSPQYIDNHWHTCTAHPESFECAPSILYHMSPQ